MGTSYSFKISKTTVYMCPFKIIDVKMKTIFTLKVTIKVTFKGMVAIFQKKGKIFENLGKNVQNVKIF